MTEFKQKFIVRVWVDIEVSADSREEASKIVKKTPIAVKGQNIYDTQLSGQVWPKGGNRCY